MRFSYLLMGVLLALLSMGALAQIDKAAMIKSCSEESESDAICVCLADRFASSLTPAEIPAGRKFVELMVEDREPSSSAEIMMVMPLMERLQRLGMECAMNTLAEEDTSTDTSITDPSIADFLPPGAMSPEDMQAMQGLMSGDGNSMALLQGMDQRDQARREKARAEREQLRAQQDAKIEQLRREYQAAVAALETPSIFLHQKEQFKRAYLLQMELAGNAKGVSQCQWFALNAATSSDKAGVLAVYWATIGGGDFDQPDEYKPYSAQAAKQYQAYDQERQSCFD